MLVQDVALEDVGAGIDQIGVDLVRAGLLHELVHLAVRPRRTRPYADGSSTGISASVARAPVTLVLAHLGGQVDVSEHVAVEHQEALVEKLLANFSAPPVPSGRGSST